VHLATSAFIVWVSLGIDRRPSSSTRQPETVSRITVSSMSLRTPAASRYARRSSFPFGRRTRWSSVAYARRSP